MVRGSIATAPLPVNARTAPAKHTPTTVALARGGDGQWLLYIGFDDDCSIGRNIEVLVPPFKVKYSGRVYVDRATVTAMLDDALNLEDATFEEMFNRLEGRVSSISRDLDSENSEHYNPRNI